MGQYNRIWDGKWVIGCTRRKDAIHFSPREREVLNLMADGKPDKEIAEALSIRTGSVKNDALSIRNKMGTKNRAHSVTEASKLGLVKL
jgi:DNA-binding CsgD family transcriptional regulator